MSGPLRFRFAAGLILAGLSTSPASSNPFTALFNPAPQEAAAPAPAKDAPAKEECLPQPGKPADGQHWVYRVDGHRKCWFLVPEQTAAVKKTVRAAKRRPAAAEENEAALGNRSTVADAARAELLPPAPAETPQPTPPAPAFRVVDADAAPVPAMGAAALVPPPPVLAKPDQLKPDDRNPRQDIFKDNLETLFAATPADSDAATVSVSSATSVVVRIFGTGDDGRWLTAPWIGPLLMALGLVSLLISTWPRRRAVLVAESSRAAEGEGRPDLLRSESDSQARRHVRRHAQATPHRSRQTIEDQRKSRPSGQRNQDMSFQEAIKVLTDFDAISVEARSTTLPPRRL
jgi:hypothetical protein